MNALGMSLGFLRDTFFLDWRLSSTEMIHLPLLNRQDTNVVFVNSIDFFFSWERITNYNLKKERGPWYVRSDGRYDRLLRCRSVLQSVYVELPTSTYSVATVFAAADDFEITIKIIADTLPWIWSWKSGQIMLMVILFTNILHPN